MEFVIDLRKSASENAQDFYAKGKKAKRKVAGAKKALEDTDRKIKNLEEKQEKVLKGSEGLGLKKKETRKQEWFEKFRWFESSDGFLVVGGKDATSNEILIKKHMDPSDIVFHADVHGAPFFVIKNPDKREVSNQTLTETSQAAVSYSKAWSTGLGSADAYWISPDQVSKTAQAGEYLTKGSFMIRGKKNYYRGTPISLAIGIVDNEDDLTVLGGPISAIKEKTKHFVTITPGEVKSGQLAKKIKEVLLRNTKKETGQKLKKLNLGEIQIWIPGGKGRLKE